LFFVNDSRESGEGIVRYNATLTLHNVAIEDSYNFSVILVDEEKGRFAIGTVTMGETANEAIRSIDNAETAIRAAWTTNRLQGLEESNSTLQAAIQAYSTMNFQEAKQLADNADDLANGATAPQAYYDAKQSIDEFARQIANATFTSPEADTLRLQAIRVFNNATVAFQQKRFDDAKSLASQSLDLLKEARETEEASKYQMTIQRLTIGLTVAIVLAMLCAIVAIVLRKRSRI
jgi:hypothetical protein